MKGFASLKEVQEAVMGSYYLPTFESHQYALSLYNRIVSHLYQHVDTDDDIERCKNDPVPNRHAMIHGYVAYTAENNSFNAIVMAETMLSVIADLKNATHSNVSTLGSRCALLERDSKNVMTIFPDDGAPFPNERENFGGGIRRG